MLNHRFNNHRRFSRGTPYSPVVINADDITSALMLVVGGRLWITGWNLNGQYGRNWTGNNIYVVKPTQLSPNSLKLSNARKIPIATGLVPQTQGINISNGLIYGWGDNSYGALGDNSTTIRNSPITIAGGGSWTSVVSMTFRGSGLKSDGTSWGWGLNTSGWIGDNTVTNKSSPVSVVGNFIFSKIALAQYKAGGIRASDGTAWCWGQGANGGVGDNTTTNRSSPVSVVGDHSFSDIVGGYYLFLALKLSDGSIWGWGYNPNGELGDNSKTAKSSPVSVVGNHSFIQVSTGGSTYALKADGSAWAWGPNSYGELGDNTVAGKSSPISVVGEHSFISIIAGFQQAFAVKNDGTVWVWGRNQYYELGPTKGSWSSPVIMSCLSTRHISIKSILPGGNDTHFIDANDIIWGLGTAQAGMFQICCRSKSNITHWPQKVLSNQYFTDGNVIQGIQTDSFFGGGGLDRNGSIWMWGGPQCTLGELGDNTSIPKYTPVSVVGNRSYKQASFEFQNGCGLDESTFSAWTWGTNVDGVLGNNSLGSRSSPVSVVGNHSFAQIFMGYQNTYFIRTDGTCWACGSASQGALGNNTTTGDKSSPISVVGEHIFVSIHSRGGSTIAIDSSGSAWGWGIDTTRQLGSGTATTPKSYPYSVRGDHSWKKIVLGYTHTVGLRIDGTAWGWGSGVYGEIGTGSFNANSSTPVSIVGNHSFVDISAGPYCSFGIKENGEIWVWGRNFVNILLSGTSVASPIQSRFNSAACLRYNGFIDDNNLFWDET